MRWHITRSIFYKWCCCIVSIPFSDFSHPVAVGTAHTFTSLFRFHTTIAPVLMYCFMCFRDFHKFKLKWFYLLNICRILLKSSGGWFGMFATEQNNANGGVYKGWRNHCSYRVSFWYLSWAYKNLFSRNKLFARTHTKNESPIYFIRTIECWMMTMA